MTSMYDRIGGAETVSAVVEEFYRRVLSDQELAQHFAGRDMAQVKERQVHNISAMLGARDCRSGASGRRVRAERLVGRADIDRAAKHLLEALETVREGGEGRPGAPFSPGDQLMPPGDSTPLPRRAE